jgi:hypothetical protein
VECRRDYLVEIELFQSDLTSGLQKQPQALNHVRRVLIGLMNVVENLVQLADFW